MSERNPILVELCEAIGYHAAQIAAEGEMAPNTWLMRTLDKVEAALAAAPAQERIDALELEVRQLTEQIAELRHAPTPQADSQPAPVLVYPPLPEPFIGVKNQPWVGHAEVIRSAIGEDGVIPCFTAGQMVAYADATHAARAPADSVLEDAARYLFLRDGKWRDTDLEPVILLQLNSLWDVKIDAARKQGANHD